MRVSQRIQRPQGPRRRAPSAVDAAGPGERIDLLDLRCESYLALGDIDRARDGTGRGPRQGCADRGVLRGARRDRLTGRAFNVRYNSAIVAGRLKGAPVR
jgi:hypothetical protein